MKKFNHNLIVSIVTVIVTTVSFLPGLTGPISTLAAGPATINLRTAGSFAILAKTGISTTGATSIVGDIGVSPVAASYITGFGLTTNVSSTFSTSAKVAGKVYAADYDDPTPSVVNMAVLDMQAAYSDAAGRTSYSSELGAGDIGGLTLAPGVYKWSTDVSIESDITLLGGPDDVWIFQIGGNLNVGAAAKIMLSGGAQAGNIFWQVAGQATLEEASVFNGNILAKTAVALNTGAQLNGRVLAQAAVTLDANIIIRPNYTTPIPTPTLANRLIPGFLGFTTLADLSLKEGDTISASGSNDPDIYIPNDWGYKRLFLNPIIFSFYGQLGGYAKVKTISASTRDMLVTSGLFRNCETNDPKVYGVEVNGEDTATLHWVNTSGSQAVQDDSEFFKKVFCINNNEFNWYTQGSAYTSVNQVPAYSR